MLDPYVNLSLGALRQKLIPLVILDLVIFFIRVKWYCNILPLKRDLDF
jgi:hypothetical protein